MGKAKESKASIIRRRYRELGGGAEAVKQIAKEVGCRDTYVRVVARQRVYGGLSKADLKYRQQPHVQEYIRVSGARRMNKYYHANAAYRARRVKAVRERYQSDPVFRAHRIAVAKAWYHRNKSAKALAGSQDSA